ncbi:MAG TPA: TRAP transporter TatT component family protein [Candidatus Acidoferrum sp.]|nr:TRAP transporter TatT component family protein [Candidatus Acidoferrum sp.]
MLRQAWSYVLVAFLIPAAGAGCDLSKFTVKTTSKVLVRAQPAIRQESDYDLAARAIPATLKTVEGFHVVNPENEALTRILAEGYCQYATGFVEDEWEVAELDKRFDEAEYQAERATRMYLRCMGYGLELLGGNWAKAIAGDVQAFKAKVDATGADRRDGMLWTAIGLAGAINQNKDDVSLVAHLPKARALLERVVVLDDAERDRDPATRALPHVALASMAVALSKALGGDPVLGDKEFRRAMELTQNKFLLVKVFYARRYAVAVQNRELFHRSLVEVLRTDPAVWPDQRLANEIAHRKARRYLKKEKEWF